MGSGEDAELLGDLLVGSTQGDEVEYFQLALA
jgi:hypothetical protein